MKVQTLAITGVFAIAALAGCASSKPSAAVIVETTNAVTTTTTEAPTTTEAVAPTTTTEPGTGVDIGKGSNTQELIDKLGEFADVTTLASGDADAGNTAALEQDCRDGKVIGREMLVLVAPYEGPIALLTTYALNAYMDGFDACIAGDYDLAVTNFDAGTVFMNQAVGAFQ